MEKESKRAQVTIFIIIAIILATAGGLGYVINKNSSDNNFFSKTSTPELNNIKSSILECRDNSVGTAMEIIGIQGGNYDKPQKSFDMVWAFLSYYYYEGEFLMPTKETVQIQLSKAVDKEFTDCIDKLKFDKFEISHKTSKTKSTITKGNILFNIDMSLSIKGNNDTTTIEMKSVPLNVNSSLYDILEVAAYITESHKQDPNMICVTCVADMAEERNLYVNAFDVEESSVLYIISENYTSTTPYSFDFLNKYSQIANSEVSLPGVPSAAA